ncbi:MAG: bifunctional precorrin-2 dehydrogenase/sirohydrochlorin ferrochelatase [Thermoleophilia bacterium]
MALYPANLRISGRRCVIIGGGRVAARKAAALLECGALVKVVSPALDGEFETMDGNIEHVDRPYARGDLDGAFLVIAATDDDETNRAVEEEARSGNLMLNVVDKPEQCNFYVPSSIRRGELMITISTGGQLPALAKRLREQLEEEFPREWEPALELLGKARADVISRVKDEERKKQCLTDLAALDLVPLLQAGGPQAAQVEIDKCISRYLA